MECNRPFIMPNFCLINKEEVVVLGRGWGGWGGGGVGLVGQTGVPKPATNSSLRWRCLQRAKFVGEGVGVRSTLHLSFSSI